MAHSGLLDAVLGGQLRDAVAADNTALIHLLLELDAPVDVGDENDVTTLHLAAGLSDADATELLLRRNAEVDARDSKGRTPLHWAARRSDADADAVELLVRYGADVNARDSEGRTPLHHAILHKPPATAVVRALLRAGASLRAEDGEAETPLERAVALPGQAGVDVTTLILDAAGPGAASLMHDTRALNFAAYFGNEAVVELLLERGADPRLRTETIHRAPLHMVANQGHTALVRTLALAGAEVEAADAHDVTPLHIAVYKDHYLTACALVTYGADIYKPHGRLRPPLWLAWAMNSTSLVSLLINFDAIASAKGTYARHAAAAPALGYLEPLRPLERQLLEAVGPIGEAADQEYDPPLQWYEMVFALVLLLLILLLMLLLRLLLLGVRKLRRRKAVLRRTAPQRPRVPRGAAVRADALTLRDVCDWAVALAANQFARLRAGILRWCAAVVALCAELPKRVRAGVSHWRAARPEPPKTQPESAAVGTAPTRGTLRRRNAGGSRGAQPPPAQPAEPAALPQALSRVAAAPGPADAEPAAAADLAPEPADKDVAPLEPAAPEPIPPVLSPLAILDMLPVFFKPAAVADAPAPQRIAVPLPVPAWQPPPVAEPVWPPPPPPEEAVEPPWLESEAPARHRAAVPLPVPAWLPPPAAEPPPPPPPPVLHNSEQHEQGPLPPAALLCTVCMDAPLEGTFLPCGHMAACMDCGEQLIQKAEPQCPICRVACDRFLRIFIHGA
jgi:ankyrin repeat protein